MEEEREEKEKEKGMKWMNEKNKEEQQFIFNFTILKQIYISQWKYSWIYLIAGGQTNIFTHLYLIIHPLLLEVIILYYGLKLSRSLLGVNMRLVQKKMLLPHKKLKFLQLYQLLQVCAGI